jgi:hypothetical protein
MKKDFLKGISKENKREFLNKLQSGQFELLPPYEPQPTLTFDLQSDGLYLCKEDGRKLSISEIEVLKGYRLNIELVSTRLQVVGKEPPDTIIKQPYTQEEYLNSLLKNKSAMTLTFDETDGQFKTDTDNYSFNQLIIINRESPEIEFYMDKKTNEKYLECLENWC